MTVESDFLCYDPIFLWVRKELWEGRYVPGPLHRRVILGRLLRFVRGLS